MTTQILKLNSDLLDSPQKINWIIERIKDFKSMGFGIIVIVGVPLQRHTNVKSGKSEELSSVVANQAAFIKTSVNLLGEVLKSRGLNSLTIDEDAIGLIPSGDILESRIMQLNPQNVANLLEKGVIPVISGSFGLSREGKIISLGFGGAEALSVGLAASFDDTSCFFFQGTGFDPKVQDKQFYSCIRGGSVISYQECMEIEVAGGHILPARVIELAEKHEIPIWLTPFFSDQEGLCIMKKQVDESFAISAVVSDTNTAKIAILGVPDVPGIAAKIFTGLAEAEITAEMIIQSVMRGQINDIAFLVRKEDMETAIEKCRIISREIGAQGVTFDTEIARVTMIGAGIANHPEVPSRMFSILADRGVNLEMIVASSISITCVVDSSSERDAVDSLKKYFIDEISL